MSNYPNMSYCQCENTLMALRQVLDSMSEDGVEFLQDMSREERRAFNELFETCAAFMQLSEELVSEEEEFERDGQPDEAQEWHDFDPDC